MLVKVRPPLYQFYLEFSKRYFSFFLIFPLNVRKTLDLSPKTTKKSTPPRNIKKKHATKVTCPTPSNERRFFMKINHYELTQRFTHYITNKGGMHEYKSM